MDMGLIVFLSLLCVLFSALMIFLLMSVEENMHSNIYHIKHKHDKLKKRLLYDDSVDVECTMRDIRKLEIEFNIEKPDYGQLCCQPARRA